MFVFGSLETETVANVFEVGDKDSVVVLQYDLDNRNCNKSTAESHRLEHLFDILWAKARAVLADDVLHFDKGVYRRSEDLA